MARDNHPDRFKDPAERDEVGQRFQQITEGCLLAKDKAKQRQAVDLLNQAMQKDPTSPESHRELGALYSRTGMLVRAERVYENALKQLPNYPELKRRFAQVKEDK